MTQQWREPFSNGGVMSLVNDPLATIIVAIIAATPGLLALWTRRRITGDRTEVSRFTALFDAQGRMVEECKERCTRLEEQLKELHQTHSLEITAIRDKHRREIEEFESRHDREIEGWERKYLALEGNYRDLQERMNYLEGLLRSMGRRTDRSSGGNKETG